MTSDIQSTAERVGVAIECAADGTIEAWSREAEAIFGHAAKDAIGRGLALFIAPARVCQAARVLARTVSGENVGRFETVALDVWGTELPVSISFSRMLSAAGSMRGVALGVRLISQRELAEIEHARLAAIVDSSDDAIVSKTLDGIITTWNRAAERIFGFTAAEAIGQHITLIIPKERIAEEEKVLASLRAGRKVDHFETKRRRKDGTYVDISLTVSPIKDGTGQIIGASKIARDVTERHRIEADRARVISDLERSNRAKDEFLAMLGHELRNPLGAISTAANLLQDLDADSPTARRARGVLARQTKHLGKLVDDLLDVGRVLAGKVTLEKRPVNLAEAVAAHIEQQRAHGKLEHHAVTEELDEVWIDADPVRAEQIVQNLVENALQYTEPGRAVRVRVHRVDEWAEVSVEDEGIGMAAELVPNVFELFVQGQRKLDRTEGGIGVGLTLVRRLAELHGGSASAKSRGVGLGSTFAVRFPVLPLDRVPVETQHQDQARAQPSRRRILLVEDNLDAREMLGELLRRGGHEVHEAADGAQGLESALRNRPDIALVDIGLPGLDGYEVARRIRAESGGDQMLLVAVTGYGSQRDRERAHEAGFDVHITKPIDLSALAKVIEGERSD
jgi:PAS domain S-box-containing protein